MEVVVRWVPWRLRLRLWPHSIAQASWGSHDLLDVLLGLVIPYLMVVPILLVETALLVVLTPLAMLLKQMRMLPLPVEVIRLGRVIYSEPVTGPAEARSRRDEIRAQIRAGELAPWGQAHERWVVPEV